MIIYIVKSPIYTAKILSKEHLDSQIDDCYKMIESIENPNSSFNGDSMYKHNKFWLTAYLKCLQNYKKYLIYNDAKYLECAGLYSEIADRLKPTFLCDEFYKIISKVLYLYDPEHYVEFKEY